jgi:hypothetical protein
VGYDVGADGTEDEAASPEAEGDAELPGDVEDEDATPEAGDDVPPQPGEPGYPCTLHSQCNSGVCIDTPNGKVCAQACLEECPASYTCKSLTMGSDVVLVCVPLYLYLCDPCHENKDCGSEFTGGTALCVDGGGAGAFCGGECSAAGKCPAGYKCEEVADVLGFKSKQCVPDGAECACSATAIQKGLTTSCYNKVGADTCTGARRCTVAGLTACDAKTPQPEACDGVDNNCNGLIDENLTTEIECSKEATWDGVTHTCKGKGECVNGHVVNCDATTPVPEVCNGLDDDCNGVIDDAKCDDGNDCTLDKCNANGDGSCVHEIAAGNKCDDGNPCTINDHCDVNGACVSGSFKNCSDGNDCTDDSCDTGDGTCLHKNNVKPCEDGNLCTENDKCQAGVCTSGPTKSCDDGNPCRKDFKCESSTGGCTWKPANEGGSCNDNDECTATSSCSNGQCAPGVDVCDMKDCPVPPGKIFCAAPACSLLGPPLGLLCICACI